MIIKYFIYTISLFFILLINGCFRSQDTSHTSKLSEYQVKKYQDLLVQEQRKRQDLEYELNKLKNNNNNGQNLEISELNSKIKTLETDLKLKDYLNKSQKESKDLEILTKDMEINNLKSKVANLKNIASIKDIKYLTDTSKAPDLSQAKLDYSTTEEIAETIVNKNINEIKNLLTSSKAPQEVIDAVKRQLQTKGYGYDQINNILNPKITINDKDITAIDKQAKDQLILQLQHASEQEKLAFQNNLVNKIENNILTNEETLEVFYKVVDLNNQKDELFNNPKLMPV